MTVRAVHPRAVTVAALLAGHAEVPLAQAGTLVSGLALDSRQLRPGDAFVALAGAHSHGLRHAGEAARRGTACLLFEPPAPADIELPVNAIPVAGLHQRLGAIADRFFDSPSSALAVIGVTGTNGKTSTVQLIAQALDRLGRGPCGTIGTLGLGLAGELRVGERTTPDVISVHAGIDELRERGARALAMEVSSHALDQGRVDAVRFRVAVFTNLSRDHLDYHGDMARYGEAKARLLQWPALEARVVNIDDAFGAELAAGDGAGELWTHSSRDNTSARLRAEVIVLDAAGIGFDLVEAGQRVAVRSPLYGRFNVDNLLAVAGCLRALNVPLPALGDLFAQLTPVAGRMNRIAASAGAPLVVVDYAHTPDALQQALDSLRAHTPGRLVCVFGCGGERDRGKRAQMGAIAEAAADRIIITDDNPRHEDGNAIVAEIRAGFASPEAAQVERDRGRAIALAINEAAAGDIVLIAGKGHEPYQQIADFRLPFDDAVVARRVLEAKS